MDEVEILDEPRDEIDFTTANRELDFSSDPFGLDKLNLDFGSDFLSLDNLDLGL